MNIATVRSALASRVNSGTSLRCTAYVPDQINPPSAFIEVDGVNYRYDYSPSGVMVALSIVVLLSSADSQRSQVAIDDYLSSDGSESMFAAIEADPDLGVTGVDTVVTSAASAGMYELGGVQYVGVKFAVEVTGP